MPATTRFARLVRAALAALLVPTAACYHQVVETGRPASATVIDKPWQMSFVYGLVPPPAVQTAAQCPGGVAKVETQHSFLNGLVAAVTFGIVTPIRLTVTCASGGRASLDRVQAGHTVAERQAALDSAATRAVTTGNAIEIQF
jgi:hypothetical protein